MWRASTEGGACQVLQEASRGQVYLLGREREFRRGHEINQLDIGTDPLAVCGRIIFGAR